MIAWGSRQMAAKFLRGMVLPVEWEGKVTGTWLSGHRPPSGNWKLHVDHVIAVEGQARVLIRGAWSSESRTLRQNL